MGLTASHPTAYRWGRKLEASWLDSLMALTLVLVCPTCLILLWIALEHCQGSLTTTCHRLYILGAQDFFGQYSPSLDLTTLPYYMAWLLFQATLFIFLPGQISHGQNTPAGNLLQYKTNGLLAWTITHILFLIGGYLGYYDLAILAKHSQSLLWIAIGYGFILPALCLVKSHLAPSYPEDRKFSGSLIFDYFVGVELNPRFGSFDLKLYNNGRVGMMAWTLISLSFTFLQYQEQGRVSNSIIIVDILHFIYVLDFFYNESWYLRTMDMNHDHFGFYLGFGCVAIVPFFYTIQVQYLARFPVELSNLEAALVLLLGLCGYSIFRVANNQKDRVRATNGDCTVWGRPAKYLRCPYKTEDGKKHDSLLLTTGWWGFTRHANYLGDILLAFAMGASSGSSHLIPWLYTFFLVAVLLTRLPRDEARCSRKYGHHWKLYCDQVPCRLLPGIF